MASAGFKQEMPPEGGYSPFNVKRVPARTLLSGYKIFAGYGLISAFSMYMYAQGYSRMKRLELEQYDGDIALEPLLRAEKDRLYLKQLKKNFEEEKRVMKNVPGWKVGTYYGEPLYKTMSPNYHVDPPMEEYYAHTDPKKSDYAWFYWYNHF
ncbi:NADH dehydrogenase [ubiquinone] 1 alpha subcomplex subunit 13 [Ixodes scapularis]|nr:NADH dehydrogenase [ubiquinone] 1 alpha subcomplex subunit 13 [Ixodes scapularis]